MHKHVELLIGRLVTDSELRRRFAARPLEVLRAQGLDLTEVELSALGATAPAALHALAVALDPRLRKVPPTRDVRAPGDDDPANPS